MGATMLDIAKDLNVSVVTVSKVLSNKGNISAATRERVLQRAKELNYQKNWIASSLVTRRTFTIGLLLPDFTHPFFGEIAKAVAEAVRPQGYHVIISYFEEDPVLERTEAESLLARQVDGLVVASAQPPEETALFHSIRNRKVPFILIDRPMDDVRSSFVGVDNVAIGKLATNHLLQQGCRRIAHLRGPGVGIAARRLEGYCNALERNKLTPFRVIDAGYDDYTGHEAMRKLLQENPLPDGVFCYNDPVAIGAMQAILEAGLRVPHDIAVVGAGNVHYSGVLAVPLTTVDQGTREIGTRAAELLLEQIDSKKALRPKKVLITPRLVVRESTKRRPSNTTEPQIASDEVALPSPTS
jgi:LacI family transcriptional regulator, galactose operon repressor